MTSIRLLVLCSFILALFAGASCLAQQEDLLQENILDSSLTALRDSVARLTLENRELTALNEQMKPQLTELNKSFAAGQAAEDQLMKDLAVTEAALRQRQEAESSIHSKVLQVQGEVDLVAKNCNLLMSDLLARSAADETLRKEIVLLEQQNFQLRFGEPEATVEPDDTLRDLLAERERLNKELSGAKQSMQELRERWAAMGKSAVATDPVRVNVLRGEIQQISMQIRNKEAECKRLEAKVVAAKNASPSGRSEEFVRQDIKQRLEQEVGRLEARLEELEAESRGVRKGEPEVPSTMEHPVNSRLWARFKALSQQNTQLKAEMDRLRRAMVEADKNKARAEAGRVQK
jgi:chromosome segregation ATPase